MTNLSESPTKPQQKGAFERHLLLASVLGPLLSFAAAPLLASALGTDGRGTVAAVVSAFLIFRYVSTFGGQEAALASARWQGFGSAGAARASMRWILPISIMLTIAAWLLAPLMFRLDGDALTIFRGVLLVIPFAAVSDGLRFALTAERRSTPVVVHIVAPHVVRLLGAVLMVAFASESTFIGSWISVGGALVGVVAVGLVGIPLASSFVSDQALERRFRKFALELAPGQVARLGNRRLDQLLLGALAGSAQLGLYAVAVALAEIADLFTRSIRQIAMRSISGAEGTGVEHHFRVGLVLFIPAIAGLAIGIPVALTLLFPPEFSAALWPAEILLLAGLANYVRDVLGVFLVTDEMARTESKVQVSTLIVGVVVLAAIGSGLGAIGASLAALVSYSVGAVLVLRRFFTEQPHASFSGLVPRRADISSAVALVVPR